MPTIDSLAEYNPIISPAEGSTENAKGVLANQACEDHIGVENLADMYFVIQLLNPNLTRNKLG